MANKYFLNLGLVTLVIGLIMILSIACNITSTTTNTSSPIPITTEPTTQITNINTPTQIPSANTTLSGILAIPSVKSPWPEVEIYENPNQILRIKIGEDFSIGLDVVPRLGEHWSTDYDKTLLSLEDSKIAYSDPVSPLTGTAWFRFKAISEGNAFITFDLIAISKDIRTRLTFAFFITK